VIDGCGREITYLRVSVTDRCNFRCVYCMPPEGVAPKSHDSILRYEEITRIARLAVSLGVRSIRVTGGEPLVRKGLSGLISSLSSLKSQGLRDLSMTTNASLLAAHACGLKAAGLDRVNISLDTLRSDRFKEITRGGSLATVLEGAGAALASGMTPVKMNVVITLDNIDEVEDFAHFGAMTGIVVRFIELMPLGHAGSIQASSFVDSARAIRRLGRTGHLEPYAASGLGSGPARYHTWTPLGVKPSPETLCAARAVRPDPKGGGTAVLGFITAMSSHFCPGCNRLRLTADGRLAPCLWCPDEIDLAKVMRAGATDEELVEVIRSAAMAKPLEHGEPAAASNRRMSRLGG
jgi:cyclic pyranopterin phosphate synthase